MQPSTPVLLYDGHCRFCTGAAKRFRQLIPEGAVELKSFREAGVLESLPQVTLERCERAMQYLEPDGRVFEGAEAVVRALCHRWYGQAALVYYVPGLRQLADAVYATIARNRMRIAGRTCEDGSCSMHGR